ncbi:MAG: hypothetical protein SH850_00885 [Planctomycetaceae bacterium]|nr:hypothetical protein [Planctomycetaceae bacterium]
MLGLLVTGCGGGGEGAANRAKVYKASGKISYLGSPLIGAIVTFAPQEKQPPAIGRTDDAGEFDLTTYGGADGAAAGEFKVLVMMNDAGAAPAPQEAHSTEPGFNPGNSHSAAAAKPTGNLLPAKFGNADQTPLTAKVEPSGDNKFTFEIK